MMLRVRRAASASIPARSRSSGTTRVRSWPVSSQVAETPIERSTSRMRSTSTIRATLRSVVRPRLSSAAHSRATAAFFDDFTATLPRSGVAAGHPQVGRAGRAEADQLALQGGGQPAEQLEGQVLAALLDAGDRALAGAEAVGELLLGEAAVAAGVADEGADPRHRGVGGRVGERHAGHVISHVR